MGRLAESISSLFRNWDEYGYPGYSNEYSISARIGKHYCPYCSSLLEIKRKKQMVNSKTEEHKKFSSYAIGGNIGGNVEFNWDVFYCENCNIELSIEDMLGYERNLKKTGVKSNFDAFRKGKPVSAKKLNKRQTFLFISLVIAMLIVVAYMIVQRVI